MVTVIGVDEFGGPEKLKAFDIPPNPWGVVTFELMSLRRR